MKTHPQSHTGARELIDGLLAYSERHAARIDRLLRSSYLLDYTLAASGVLLPGEGDDSAGDASGYANGNGAAAGGSSSEEKEDGADGLGDAEAGGSSDDDDDDEGGDLTAAGALLRPRRPAPQVCARIARVVLYCTLAALLLYAASPQHWPD